MKYCTNEPHTHITYYTDIDITLFRSHAYNEYTSFTLSSAPASPPDNVQTAVLSSTEIRVSWSEVPEIDRNGIITMYEVKYEPLMTFGVLTPATVNTTNLTIIVGGLEEDVEYNISVRAYTSVGPGPYSEEITDRTFEDGELLPY